MPASVCCARATEAAAATARSRDVAMSSTSWESAVELPTAASIQPPARGWRWGRAGARARRPRGRAACGRAARGRLGLADLHETPADRQAVAGGGDQVAGRRDDVVRAANVRGRGRQRPRERDERVVREQVPQVVEAPGGRREVAVERVHRRPVDPEAGGLDASGHRLELGPQGAGVIERGQVPEDGERPAGGDEEQDDEAGPQEESAVRRRASRRRRRPSLGHGAGRRREAAIGDRLGRIVAHGAGTAMTTKRGAVG